jgi:hypothetical protein
MIAFLGWVVLVISILLSIVFFANAEGAEIVLGIVTAISGISLGLIIVVIGQLLQAVISIENNTDKASQLLEKILTKTLDATAK